MTGPSPDPAPEPIPDPAPDPVPEPLPEPPPTRPLTRVAVAKNLPLLRHRAEAAVEAKAEQVRARFATPGKHTIYDRKLREAERYLDALGRGQPPNLAAYPYLRAEAGLTAPDAEALARLWVAMAAQWEAVSPAIEAASLRAKAAVRAAPGSAAIDAAVREAAALLDAVGDPAPRPPDKPRDPFRPPAPQQPE